MTHHTRTRRRNLCACVKCQPGSGLLHGTTERAETCDCPACTAAVATLARLTDYTRTDVCGRPVMGLGTCHRPVGHPLPHIAGFTDRRTT